ncbi:MULTISPECIES: MBL fold metallo-hydrolase [Fusobacterium]|uniref:MBL fold metallo-hydrolase n=1 Tax=Fusobacterium TaxID=848 RepID=UPI001D09FF93|nr:MULTISPECIES: MBL fold metallo-hydrolase [Fusobacterium]MCB8565559.1 MBL fold metallo-hydrolase [Fusobacterium ulcerans]MCB8649562.1 MBL fold metallo-hydrolase [Fusobacterium ulcerans]MDH6456473.1 7,8-dihydropterin-6-yl-methyl-4-(beta-D-ribofuranosyl)aminobenzene 5'-phosphate synthase [Fusobacterium sp. PH5-7]
MKLTVVIDNNTYIDNYLLGEPAISYYIEVDNCRILFDAGYSEAFLSNAKKLKIDLSNLTHLIFSHGHNDHTRGIIYLEKMINLKNVKTISHPDCFFPKREPDIYIGAPYSKKEISEKTNYIESRKVYQISENFFFLGEIPRKVNFEKESSIGEQLVNEVWEKDYVKDDTALIYKNDKGIFIITGCSHSGICNIVEYAAEIFKPKKILGIIGGFHLFEIDEQVEKTIEYLKSKNIESLYPCHCTSLKVKAKMMEQLNVIEVGSGLEINI